jgi:hypothetical protein
VAGCLVSPDRHRTPGRIALPQQQQPPLPAAPQVDPYRHALASKAVPQSPMQRRAASPGPQRLLLPAPHPAADSVSPRSVRATVPSTPVAPEPAPPPTGARRPSVSALHPWPRPVGPAGDGQSDTVVVHSLRAFLGSSTIAVAHALLVTVRELEREVKELEEGLHHLRAAVASCPEVAPLIAVREQMLATLNWHLAAQREIHEHFLSHASHIARLDAAAF